jgi:cytoskeletal protein CcmA (bactofilin family)
VVGLLYVDGDLRVGGVIEGELEITGDLEVEDAATIKASVAARQVSIRGQVSGPVVARKRLVVSRSGSLIGDVQVPRLVVQDGATFSGNVSMTALSDAPPKAPVVEATPVEAAPVEAAPVEAAPVAAIAPAVETVVAPTDGAAATSSRTARKVNKSSKGKPAPTKGKPKRR